MKWLAFAVLSLCACSAPARFVRGGLEIRTFAHDSTNVHLVMQDGNAFLFDSGYEKNAPQLEADVRAAGVDPAKLKAVIVSHGHADHAGGARYFHTRFGVPVVVGMGDEGMFTAGRNEKLCPTGLIANLRARKDQDATYTGSTSDVLVNGALDLKELTGIDAKATLLPGHTSGSLVVTVGDVVLVGDLLRGGIVGSSAETHFFMCDLEDNQRGVMKLLTELAPAAQLVFVGHFGPVTPEAVRAHFVR